MNTAPKLQHIEVLRDIQNEYRAYENSHHQVAALDAAIIAIRAAVGGEAVAWRVVYFWGDGKRRGVGPWTDISTQPDPNEPIEYAYASPPATVDVGAVRKLVEKWRGITTNTDIEYGSRVFIEGYDKALNYCADELAALIGKEA